MITCAVSPENIALILEGEEADDIRQAVFLSLSGHGISPWKDMEAEIYTMGKRSLLIARPCPPARRRVGENSIRLLRH